MSAQVLKREVLVSSRHPTLYLIYWSFVWNRDCSSLILWLLIVNAGLTHVLTQNYPISISAVGAMVFRASD